MTRAELGTHKINGRESSVPEKLKIDCQLLSQHSSESCHRLALGDAQSAVSDYEKAWSASTRPTLDRRFMRRIEKPHRLSKRDQQAILGTIDAVLFKVS